MPRPTGSSLPLPDGVDAHVPDVGARPALSVQSAELSPLSKTGIRRAIYRTHYRPVEQPKSGPDSTRIVALHDENGALSGRLGIIFSADPNGRRRFFVPPRGQKYSEEALQQLVADDRRRRRVGGDR